MQDDSYFLIKPHLIFSFYLCIRLTSPNYAFMRCRLYSSQKVKLYKLYHKPGFVAWNSKGKRSVCTPAQFDQHYCYSLVCKLMANFQDYG